MSRTDRHTDRETDRHETVYPPPPYTHTHKHKVYGGYNEDFDFGKQGNKAIHFRGTREKVPTPGRASVLKQSIFKTVKNLCLKNQLFFGKQISESKPNQDTASFVLSFFLCLCSVGSKFS